VDWTKSTFRVSEELALEQRLRHGRAVDGDERSVLPLAVPVERPRDQLLSGAALPGDEDRHIGLGGLLDELEDLLHLRASPPDLVERFGLVHRHAQHLHLIAQPPMGDGAVDGVDEDLGLERLGDEIIGADPQRGDGGLHAAEGGYHDDRYIRPVGGEALAELDAVHPGHVKVGDHRGVLLLRDRFERLLGGCVEIDIEAPFLQLLSEHLAHGLVVVDD
jgi:hypothetical protein